MARFLTRVELAALMLVFLCSASCGRPERESERFRSLAGIPVPEDAQILRSRVSSGTGEVHAFFELRCSPPELQKALVASGFSRSEDEEDSEFLRLTGQSISSRMEDPVVIPDPAIHLERRGGGRIIQAFIGIRSGHAIVWIRPGPGK